jgi:glycosyltransferase involved in cell wall biosynthesis
MNIKNTIFLFFFYLFSPLLIVGMIACCVLARFLVRSNPEKPRLVWGAVPIVSYSYWSQAMKRAGYESETYTHSFYASINKREDWDLLIQERYTFLPLHLRFYPVFLESLLKYDIYFLSFEGFFLGFTPIWWIEAWLLKIAGKKTVVMPYGADAFIYKRIKSLSLLHGLLMSYPGASRMQGKIERRVDIWCKYADVVIPGIMGPDGFGRWDVLTPCHIHIDCEKWQVSQRKSQADGKTETVYIAHAPNHRGFKGTEFIVEAVNRLKNKGIKVELILLEKVQNTVVAETLREKADILVDQIVGTGYALNALEGMGSGLPVVCGLEHQDYLQLFRRWSFMSECPLVSASIEDIADVLEKLIGNPDLRIQLGMAGRQYVEKYHGYDSAQYLYGQIIDYIYGRKDRLINLYHPILGEYNKRLPTIYHPLLNNKIVNDVP